MPIDRAQFALKCVDAAAYVGVFGSLHYIVAAAQLRSQISDMSSGDEIGPFRLIQRDWDAYRTDSEFDFNFISSDIGIWEMQCQVFALMVRRAQDRLHDKLGRYPNVLELYQEQWPQAAQDNLEQGLTEALAATKDLLAPAAKAYFGEDLKVIELSDSSSGPSASNGQAEIDESKLPPGEAKREIARLIIKSFADAGFGFHQQVAALANAIAESKLDPTIHNGKGEDSWGLFQLNKQGGLGAGHAPGELVIPEKNIEIVISAAKNAKGFVKAVTVVDAVSAFVSEVERPRHPEVAINERTAIARRLLPAQA